MNEEVLVDKTNEDKQEGTRKNDVDLVHDE